MKFGKFNLKMKRKKNVLTVVIVQVAVMTVITVHLAKDVDLNQVVCSLEIVSRAQTLGIVAQVKIQMTYNEMEIKTTANSSHPLSGFLR